MNEPIETRPNLEKAFADYEQVVNEIEKEILANLEDAGPSEAHKNSALQKLRDLDQRYLELQFPGNSHDRINFHIHSVIVGKLMKQLEDKGFSDPKNKDSRIIAEGGIETDFLIGSYADSGLPLAVKILKKDANQGIREMFDQEQKVLTALSERYPDAYPPTLLRLHAIGNEVTATERIIGGQNLLTKMKESGTSLDDVTRWVKDICSGLEFLYDDGFTAHNDLSPDNFVEGDDKRIRVTDFSLVSEEPKILSTEHLWEPGKSRYMSPEKCLTFHPESKQPLIDRRSDIFAMAVNLYQFLTKGKDPFNRVGLRKDALLIAAFAKDILENNCTLLDEEKKEVNNDTLEKFAKKFQYQDLTLENCPLITDQLALDKINILIKKCLSIDLDKRSQTPADFFEEFQSALEPVSKP